MPRPLDIRTPLSRTPATQAAPGVWRKRVLPVGSIDYKGRTITFDRDYLESLAQSFSAGAYDQVPFQIADTANSHTNDPERFRGEVTGMDVQDDGLYVTVSTTEAGSSVLATNPRLGVSARIVEDYARSDGKYYPVAIQHVLGTLDPRVTGLGPWERVELSNGPEQVLDLSNLSFATEGGTMPDLTQEQQARLAKLLDIDPDKLATVADSLDAGTPEDLMTDDELAGVIENMSDDEFAALMDEYDMGEPAAEPAQQTQYAGAGLSGGDLGLSAIDLANARADETERQLGILQNQHDETAFELEKRKLTRGGIPPYIVDMARPLLFGTGRTVDLANGTTVDAGLIMRGVLAEVGKAAQMLDLSVELGSPFDEPDNSQTAEQERGAMVDRFRKQTGI